MKSHTDELEDQSKPLENELFASVDARIEINVKKKRGPQKRSQVKSKEVMQKEEQGAEKQVSGNAMLEDQKPMTL